MKVEGKNYSDVSKFCVRLISKSVAKEMIIKNHYSHLWTKVSYSIGLFYLESWWGLPVMVTQWVEILAPPYPNF
jgi:hypothetical protein